MKNLTGNFLSKLIASMPIEALRKSAEIDTRRREKTSNRQDNQVAALNRIFMVRYRIQHL